MYRIDDGQITLSEFYSPFGKLDPNNRWVRIADMIPWRELEEKYAKRFSKNNGTPAIKFRMAMGTLIIKQRTKHSDEEVLHDIIENPYMQYLIGLHEFTTEPPFTSQSITNFRKYIKASMIQDINDRIFRQGAYKKTSDDNNDDNGSNGDNNVNPPGSGPESDIQEDDIQPETPQEETSDESSSPEVPSSNEGKLILDATCAPANIAYPTDVNLLNEAREKLEKIIDTLHPYTSAKVKPRTYRNKARKDYLRFIKQRKPRKNAIRKAIGQQLRYVYRDLGHIDRQLQETDINYLSKTQQTNLETIRELYKQQRQMYETKVHTISNRIVSISQPHVRPIVRGKTNAAVEFGAKISISLINGYAFIDKLDWNAYNEESLLIPAIESYKNRYGVYPEAVLADKIYRNRDNLKFCKKHNIRLSGPRLGRPPKETDESIIQQARQDSSERNAVEGKFGEGKLKYGLNRIMARLKDTSECVISMSFFCMNISKRLRMIENLLLAVKIRVGWKPVFLIFKVVW
jgi:hypothetical protein